MSLCPGNSTRCFCRVNNMATSVTWSFSSPRTLCKNNTIVAWNASQTACGNHISARVEDCTQGVTSCQQSVLTIVGDASIDGVMVTCIETATPYVVGQSVITVPREAIHYLQSTSIKITFVLAFCRCSRCSIHNWCRSKWYSPYRPMEHIYNWWPSD